MTHRLNRIRDHVFHVEIHVCQIKILCDHQTLVLDGYRIVYGRAVRPGRVCRVADLHTCDGLRNLGHALDHRNFKVKTRCLFHCRFSERCNHCHLLLGKCIEAVKGKHCHHKDDHNCSHSKTCVLRNPDPRTLFLLLLPGAFLRLFVHHALCLIFFPLLCPRK